MVLIDGAGSVIARLHGTATMIAYTVYGNVGRYDHSGVLGFCGYPVEIPLCGYWLGNGHRFYSPTARRFYSPDSLSPFGRGGINAYAYCEGDPVNFTDPFGSTRFSNYSGAFPPLFSYLNSPGRQDFRLQGFSISKSDTGHQAVETFRVKGREGKALERTGVKLKSNGSFYVNRDRTLFIYELLVHSKDVKRSEKLGPFGSDLIRRGFDLMSVNPDFYPPEVLQRPPRPVNVIEVTSDGVVTDHSRPEPNSTSHTALAIRRGTPERAGKGQRRDA